MSSLSFLGLSVQRLLVPASHFLRAVHSREGPQFAHLGLFAPPPAPAGTQHSTFQNSSHSSRLQRDVLCKISCSPQNSSAGGGQLRLSSP